MKILHLTLKKKWFDMIASGEKIEEYREIKPYWTKRLEGQSFDAVQFRNGYSKDAPTLLIEYKGMFTGTGQSSWGAPNTFSVYILKLGQILETKITFRSDEVFQAQRDAEKWLSDHGYSCGSTCAMCPTGILKGDFIIAKWRNLTTQEIGELDGFLSGDSRNGPVKMWINNLKGGAL